MTTKKAKKISCPWGCGKKAPPGPMVQHAKVCPNNPEAGYTVQQPTGTCPYCGLTTTRGALATHERYGCLKRPVDGPARRTCRWCHKVTTLPGALAGHERSCDKNPANPQPVRAVKA